MSFQLVKLGRFLKHRAEFVEIDDTREYKRIRVQLHGRGIVLRDTVDGSQVKTKKQQLVRTGDFVVAEIDAKLGGFGIAPEGVAGGIVSSHYFLFDIDESICLRGWLAAVIQSGRLEEQVTARGSTNYAAIRPDSVPNFEIPLPPLPEQRRIVARIEALASRIEEVRRLRQEVHTCARRLLLARFREVIANARWLPMTEVAPLVRRAVEVDPDKSYAELGIRSFGRGTFHKSEQAGFDLGEKRVFWIEPGDLLFNIVFAWEGAVAVAKSADKGRVGSHRFLTCVSKPELATADFLSFYFLTSDGLQQLGNASPGGAGRNRTLGLDALAKISVPVPEYACQLRFDALQKRFSKIALLQAEADQKLASVLPSYRGRAFN